MKWINLVLFLITLISIWVIPTFAYVLALIALIFSLAFSTYAIYTKHKETEHARAKILKEIGVMLLTFIIILFFGGIAAILANAQVSVRWGAMAGFVSAIAASFVVGYFVRVGVGRVMG